MVNWREGEREREQKEMKKKTKFFYNVNLQIGQITSRATEIYIAHFFPVLSHLSKSLHSSGAMKLSVQHNLIEIIKCKCCPKWTQNRMGLKKKRRETQGRNRRNEKKHTLNGVCWASGIRRKSENFVIVIMWTSNWISAVDASTIVSLSGESD